MDAIAPRHLRVLLVEDDATAARMLAKLLREDGYDVEVALDGAAAVSRLSRAPTPDVLVTDYKLPHVDGLAVGAYARTLSPRVAIVVVTSYPELLGRDGSRKNVADEVLEKPLEYVRLANVLERLRSSLDRRD